MKGAIRPPKLEPPPAQPNNDVRPEVIFFTGDPCLFPDNRLVQKNMVQYAAQHVAAIIGFEGYFHGFGDGTAQGAAVPGFSARILFPTSVVSEGEGMTFAP